MHQRANELLLVVLVYAVTAAQLGSANSSNGAGLNSLHLGSAAADGSTASSRGHRRSSRSHKVLLELQTLKQHRRLAQQMQQVQLKGQADASNTPAAATNLLSWVPTADNRTENSVATTAAASTRDTAPSDWLSSIAGPAAHISSPEPNQINNITGKQGTNFDASSSKALVGTMLISYDWEVAGTTEDGLPYETTFMGVKRDVVLPAGQYSAALTVQAAGKTGTGAQGFAVGTDFVSSFTVRNVTLAQGAGAAAAAVVGLEQQASDLQVPTAADLRPPALQNNSSRQPALPAKSQVMDSATPGAGAGFGGIQQPQQKSQAPKQAVNSPSTAAGEYSVAADDSTEWHVWQPVGSNSGSSNGQTQQQHIEAAAVLQPSTGKQQPTPRQDSSNGVTEGQGANHTSQPKKAQVQAQAQPQHQQQQQGLLAQPTASSALQTDSFRYEDALLLALTDDTATAAAAAAAAAAASSSAGSMSDGFSALHAMLESASLEGTTSNSDSLGSAADGDADPFGWAFASTIQQANSTYGPNSELYRRQQQQAQESEQWRQQLKKVLLPSPPTPPVAVQQPTSTQQQSLQQAPPPPPPPQQQYQQPSLPMPADSLASSTPSITAPSPAQGPDPPQTPLPIVTNTFIPELLPNPANPSPAPSPVPQPQDSVTVQPPFVRPNTDSTAVSSPTPPQLPVSSPSPIPVPGMSVQLPAINTDVVNNQQQQQQQQQPSPSLPSPSTQLPSIALPSPAVPAPSTPAPRPTEPPPKDENGDCYIDGTNTFIDNCVPAWEQQNSNFDDDGITNTIDNNADCIDDNTKKAIPGCKVAPAPTPAVAAPSAPEVDDDYCSPWEDYEGDELSFRECCMDAKKANVLDHGCLRVGITP